ncbi:Cinnamoyl-CoA reductase 2, partial [Ananas comosus]
WTHFPYPPSPSPEPLFSSRQLLASEILTDKILAGESLSVNLLAGHLIGDELIALACNWGASFSPATTPSTPPSSTSDAAETEHLRALDGAAERLQLFAIDLPYPDSLCATIRGCGGVFHLASSCTVDRVLDPQYAAVGNEGPAILFVHGFGAFLEHFRDNIASVAEAENRVWPITLLAFLALLDCTSALLTAREVEALNFDLAPESSFRQPPTTNAPDICLVMTLFMEAFACEAQKLFEKPDFDTPDAPSLNNTERYYVLTTCSHMCITFSCWATCFFSTTRENSAP